MAFHYETCDSSWFWASRPDTSAPEIVWAAENKPHMMVTIANMHEGDGDSLLVNEIRVIISLMTIRLLNNSFRDENMAPVQEFSFTCSRQGRILQAHMNDNSLMIRRSRLFAFSGRRDAPFNLLLRHVVGSLQGSTRILNDPQIEYDFSQ